MERKSLRKLLSLIVAVLGIGAGVVSPFIAAPSPQNVNQVVGIEETETAKGNTVITEDEHEEAHEENVQETPQAVDVEHVHNLVEELVAAPTCLTEGELIHRCTDCDYMYSEILFPTGHTAGEWIDVSDTERVLTCTVCGETLGTETKEAAQDADAHQHNYVGQVSREATCKVPGEMVYTCSCGATYVESIPVIAHSFTLESKVEPTCKENGSIIKECEKCGLKLETAVIPKLPHTLGAEEITLEATCTTDGEKKQVCDVCGEEVITKIPATGHSLSDYTVVTVASCETDGLEKAVCNVCGEEIERVIPATGHSYALKSKQDSTCNDDGVEVYQCDLCGATKEVAISAKGHQAGEWETTIEVGCETEGLRHKHCTVCGAELETEAIPPTGHSYGEWVVEKDATCTSDGTRSKTCGACNNVVRETIPATGHTEGEWEVVKEATDLDTGLRKKSCVTCGVELAEEEIPKLPHTHDYTEETDRVEPECEKAGSVTLACRCGETITQTLNALGHDNEVVDSVVPTCDLGGYTKSKCRRCGKESQEDIPALGHTPNDWTVVKEATDLEAGEEVRTCETCGATLETRVIEKLPHTCEFTTETEKVDATCVTDGFVVRQCRCGKTDKEVIPAKGHVPGEWIVVKEPTYTEKGLKEQSCEVCGTKLNAENIDVIPHEHDYEAVIDENATCTADGSKTLTCKVCGDTKTETIPATGHTEAWEVTKAATCTEAGSESLKCSVCGNVSDMRSIPALGHEESDWVIDNAATCTANGKQHKSCTRCGAEVASEIIEATGHSYGGFETTKEPTCTEAGEQTKTCGTCGDTITVSIDPKGHSYGDWIIDVEPTEDAGGERHKECSECGDRITEDVDPLPRHEHDFGETGRTDSTCTQEGSITYTCSICGESYSETIPMKAHTAGDWETEKMATEQEAGLKVKKCTACGTVVESEIIEKLPHLHDYAVNRVEADCLNDGYVEYTCECGDSYREVIKATGHSYEETETVQPTCEKDGYVKQTCANCGDVITETIDKLNHNYVETERVEPTCGKAGHIVRTCENCKDVQTEVIDALEHDFQETNRVEPTCTSDGYVEYTCSICGEVKTEENGTATGHNFGEWETTTEAKLGKDGERTRTCEGCGKIETEKIDMLLTDGDDSVYYVDMGGGNQKMVIGHYDSVESEMIFELVNDMRTAKGFSPYLKADFQDFSETRALELAVLWGHERPNGKQFAYAENVAMAGGRHGADFAVADYFVGNWENSSGHKANMLSESSKYTGVAVFYSLDTESYWENGSKAYSVYAAQNFCTHTREQKNQIIHGDCEDI